MLGPHMLTLSTARACHPANSARRRAAGADARYDLRVITGWTFSADQSARPLESIDALGEALARADGVTWVDLEAPDDEELHALGAVLNLSPEALEDCRVGEQRPRIDEFDDYLFLVLYGMLGLESEEYAPRKLAAFVGERFLATIHREPLVTIKTVNERCGRHPSKTLANGVDVVLYHIIDGMIDKYLLVSERHEERLEDLEERSLASEFDADILADAGELRRTLIELRRLAVAQRELITPLARGQFGHVSDTLEQRFQHVVDHLSQVIDVTDGVRERLNAVRDNYHASLASRTNEAMQRLTIVATVMLPMSVIAGVYGMNVPLWPVGDSPSGFWVVIGLMVLVSGGLMAYFRRKRWV